MHPTTADIAVFHFEIFILMLVRMSCMVFLFPVFSSRSVSSLIKVGLSLFMTLAVYFTMGENTVPVPEALPMFFLLVLKEAIIGLLIGFSFSLLFLCVTISGSILDHNTGFSVIQSINPLSDENETVIGELKFLVFSALFLVTGAYLQFFQVLVHTFHKVPVLSGVLDFSKTSFLFNHLISQSFIYGLKLAAPVLVPLLLTTVALAVVSRIMPQINVWLVGMPLKIGLGLILLGATLPLLWKVYQAPMEALLKMEMSLIQLMKPLAY